MIRDILSHRFHAKLCCFLVFLFAAAISFSGFYNDAHFQEVGLPGGWDNASFQRMVDGTADRPYVYRQLLPSVANWADRVAPQRVKLWFYYGEFERANPTIVAVALSPAAKDQTWFFRYIVLYFTTFLFAFLAAVAMYLVCVALEVPRPAAVLASVCLILLVPYIQRNAGMFYDFPELAFFALAVWIALRFDWFFLLPIAILAECNKESFLFFIPTLYPFLLKRYSRRSAFLIVVFLCFACGAVYFPIHQHFAHNPGNTADLHLLEQLRFFAFSRELFYARQEAYGIPLPAACSVLPLLVLFLTVRRAWPALPSAVKSHAKLAAAINLPLFLLFGIPGEIRALGMLYITLLMVLAATTNDLFKPRAELESP